MTTDMTTGTKQTSTTSTGTALLAASGIHKSFPVDGRALEVLHGVDIAIADDEFVTVMGRSGSGKSTLLYSVSGLDTIDAGTVTLAGNELTSMSSDELADYRREHMGFVFQQPTLLRDLGLLDNILLTSALDRVGSPAERVARAEELMVRTGIWDLRDRMPSQVSGGQLQRAGVCRALIRRPSIVFGDEPTGSLNSSAAAEIMDLLGELSAEGTALLVVTHDVRVAARSDRVVFMIDGLVADHLLLDPYTASRGDASKNTRVDAITTQMRHLGI